MINQNPYFRKWIDMIWLKTILSMKKIFIIKKVIWIFEYVNHWFKILDGKQYLGCLVKSKYADNSDQIEFYLFENKIIRNVFLCLDLIEYEK